MRELKKGLKVLLLTLGAYLIQGCVMEHLSMRGTIGSVEFAVIAILMVSYGKKYAFCSSCMIGVMKECMVGNVPAFYAIAYPVIAMLCAQFFADMSDRKRERLRTLNTTGSRRETDYPAEIRIPLCAGLMDALLNIVLCAYLYLIGVDLSFFHIARLFGSMVYTVALAAGLMLPLRAFLGMYRRRKRNEGGELL